MMKRLQNDPDLAEKDEVPNLLEYFSKHGLIKFDSHFPGSEKNLFAWRLVPIAIYLGIFQSVYFLSGLIDNGHLKNNWQIVRDLGSVPFLFIILFCLYNNKFFFTKPWKKKEINFW